jgi:hypothetical protein
MVCKTDVNRSDHWLSWNDWLGWLNCILWSVEDVIMTPGICQLARTEKEME